MGKKILIVDDEPDVVSLLQTRLESQGFEVITAKDGTEGLDKVRRDKPDVIILDVLMPGMTGYQFIETLKKEADESIRKTPVIVYSAKWSMQEFFNPWDVYAFLRKPFRAEELLAKIGEIVGAPVAPQAAPVPKPEAAPEPPKAAKGAMKSVLIAGIEDFIVKKIGDFFRARKVTVHLALDEKDTLKTAAETRPALILCQFWEDPHKFYGQKIYRELQANQMTQSIAFAVFCTDSVSLDAVKSVPPRLVLSYNESSELLKKVEEFVASLTPGKA